MHSKKLQHIIKQVIKEQSKSGGCNQSAFSELTELMQDQCCHRFTYGSFYTMNPPFSQQYYPDDWPLVTGDPCAGISIECCEEEQETRYSCNFVGSSEPGVCTETTDPSAPYATLDECMQDGCEEEPDEPTKADPVKTGEDIGGCTDENAVNYNPEATYDDGSCIYEEKPPDDVTWVKPPKDPVSPVGDDDIVGEADPIRPGKIGCTDPQASNYDPQAEITCDEDNYDGPQLNFDFAGLELTGKPICCDYATDKPEEPIDLNPYTHQCLWCSSYNYITGEDEGYWYIIPPPGAGTPEAEAEWPPAGIGFYPGVMHDGVITPSNCNDFNPYTQELTYGGNSLTPGYDNVQEYCGGLGFTDIPDENAGCTYEGALNYDSEAIIDDGSCEWPDLTQTDWYQILLDGPCGPNANLTEYGSCLEEYTFMSWLPNWLGGGWESYGTAANNIWGGDCAGDCWIEELDDAITQQALGPVADVLNSACAVTNWLNTTPFLNFGDPDQDYWGIGGGADFTGFVEPDATQEPASDFDMIVMGDCNEQLLQFFEITSQNSSLIPGLSDMAYNSVMEAAFGYNPEISAIVNYGDVVTYNACIGLAGSNFSWGDLIGDVNQFIDSQIPFGLEWHCEGDQWAGFWDEDNNFWSLFEVDDWIENWPLQLAESLIMVSCWAQDLGCEPFAGLGGQNPDGPGGCSMYGCECCADPLWGLCNGSYTAQDFADYVGVPLNVLQPAFDSQGYGYLNNVPNTIPFCQSSYGGDDWGLDWPWWQSQQQGSIQATYNFLACENMCGLNGPNCPPGSGWCPPGYECNFSFYNEYWEFDVYFCQEVEDVGLFDQGLNESNKKSKSSLNESVKNRLQKLAGIKKSKK